MDNSEEIITLSELKTIAFFKEWEDTADKSDDLENYYVYWLEGNEYYLRNHPHEEDALSIFIGATYRGKEIPLTRSILIKLLDVDFEPTKQWFSSL